MELLAFQDLGGIAIADALKRDHRFIRFCRPQRNNRKPPAAPGRDRTVEAEIFGSERKGLHPHLALDAVRSEHGAEQHTLGQAYAAGAGVPAAALARSCAFFFGFAFSGLLCWTCFK